MADAPKGRATFEIIERQLIGKSVDPDLCEDDIFVGAAYVAVIDGATSKSEQLLDGRTGGRAVVDTLIGCFHSLPAGLFEKSLIDALTAAVRERIKPTALWTDKPHAAIAVLDIATMQITRVGDIGLIIGTTAFATGKKIDAVAAQARAAYTHAVLGTDGITEQTVATDDPGRAFILPLLQRQHIFQNNADGPFGFGTIDGRAVPDSFIETIALPAKTQLIMCSDGYTALCPTLDAAENALSQSLRRDPLRIGTIPGTKGYDHTAQQSYDDRAYLRLKVTQRN